MIGLSARNVPDVGEDKGVARVPQVDDALPVEVVGPTHVVAQVSAWVEAHLGWQVTDGGHLPAVVCLAATGVDDEALPTTMPMIALVGPDDDPNEAAHHARRAAAVVSWPADHEELAGVVAEVVASGADDGHDGKARDGGRFAPGHFGPGDRAGRASPGSLGSHGSADGAGAGDGAVGGQRLVVGAAAGGVGATTVALVLAAWQVWRRQDGRCLAVVSGPVPVPDAMGVAPEVLAGHRAWAAGVAVPDLPALHVARATSAPVDVRVPTGVGLVWDLSVVAPDDDRLDVLVVRRDRAGLEAAAATTCSAVVVVDHGPIAMRAMQSATEGRRVVVVPWSVRVARAHAMQRVPCSLPGRWVTPLGDLVM